MRQHWYHREYLNCLKNLLLILDEWLLDDLSEEEQYFLFELIERRHDTSSTIYCTQFVKEDWHARLGGGVHADTMMDRIVHSAAWMFTGHFLSRFASHVPHRDQPQEKALI